MIGSKVRYVANGASKSGCVTDVIYHLDATADYEVMGEDGMISYVPSRECSTWKTASMSEIPRHPGNSEAVMRRLRDAAKLCDDPALRARIEELTG